VENGLPESLALMFAYVGSFTTKKRNAHGEGIKVYRVDASGHWALVQLVSSLVNPSFLTVSSDRSTLYSVHADRTDVTAFRIDGESGRLSRLNVRSTEGKNPVHLAIDPSGRFLVTANYAAGTVTVLSLAHDGSLGALVGRAALTGEPGPHRREQTSSHPHHAPFDPAGRFVLVPDKGLDRIFVFRFDASTGSLLPAAMPSVKTREGAGPRHIAFHPLLPCAYVINELDSTVTTYRFDAESGELSPLHIVPTLPSNFSGNNTGSEIAVAPSGGYVYGSNRGHDSIVAFAVDPASGLLNPISWESTHGGTPRFFAVDWASNLLYAANEATDTIIPFRIDGASGKLSFTGTVVENLSPACIAFR
jgi:6-phosphogluconolactonase